MNILYKWRDVNIITRNTIPLIVYSAIFSAVSIILAFMGSFSIFPVFPFLKADISDVPVFLATLLFGIPSGITILLTVSIIRALLFSSSGWIGFVIRITSAIVVIFLGTSKKCKNKLFKIFIITLGIALCLILKLSLNYFFWINFFSISKETINSLLFTIILPYNIIKILISILLAFMLRKYLDKYIKLKYR